MNFHMTRLIHILMLYPLPVLALWTSPQTGSFACENQSNLVLGVLEEHPGTSVGEPSYRAIRVLFKKVYDSWQSFPYRWDDIKGFKSLPKSFPEEVNWTIAFDGRRLGQITAQTLNDFYSMDCIGYQRIIGAGPIPTVGKRSELFSGFLFSPVYRPLVAVSQAYFQDPDVWKNLPPSLELIKTVRQKFRQQFPKAMNCRNQTENIQMKWEYKDEDIEILKRYTSKRNWSLVNLHLKGWACDGPQDDGSPFTGQWYLVESSGASRFIGANMWLVDAGDYDNDGKSEVLFSIEGYNRGGYRLFYKDFNKKAEFLFAYH